MTHPNRPFAVAVRSELGSGPVRGAADLSGELDLASIGQLRDTLSALRREGYRHVVLDLSGLDFLDAAGLGALVRADRLFRDGGATLVLTGLRPAQRRLLEITGLDRTLLVE
ncbi:STAS domain-containing protein [Pseudonocardia humida]|uniref:Anti-sigma factor antagonist n=1 Tax=Pseudonocardia humida TaxID=2800819 RepID=A0ABT1A2K2_9PSEU|nr:STAS domain-containing protein [Pseudonocardia humida]MCO1657186.1 STAS domain-containing protein [Pseudonocardia humida]